MKDHTVDVCIKKWERDDDWVDGSYKDKYGIVIVEKREEKDNKNETCRWWNLCKQ